MVWFGLLFRCEIPRGDKAMKDKIHAWIFLCSIIPGCSHPILMTPKKITDGYLILLKLSDDGIIEKMADQIKLPYPITGKSDIISEEGIIYVGSYKHIYVLSLTDGRKLKLLSSIPPHTDLDLMKRQPRQNGYPLHQEISKQLDPASEVSPLRSSPFEHG